MNQKLSIIIGAIAINFMSSCTPNQINSAIEACKGDSECYEIIDDAIEEELEGRGITGGRMTNIEMRALYDLYESFNINIPIYNYFLDNNYGYSGQEEPPFGMTDLNTNSQLSFIFGMAYLANNYQVNFGDQLDLNTFFSLILEFETFELESLYLENKQFMVIDNVKHILFKIGNERYKYEMVSPSTTLAYYFDLTFGSIGTYYVSVTKSHYEKLFSLIDALNHSTNDIYYVYEGPNNYQFYYLSKAIMIEGILFWNQSPEGIKLDYTLGSNVTLFENDDFSYRFDLSLAGLMFNGSATLETIIEGYSSITTNVAYKKIIEDAVRTVLSNYASTF